MTTLARRGPDAATLGAGATAAPGQHAVVFDLSTLRFRMGPQGRSVSVTAATGEHLGFAQLPAGCDQRTAAHRALEKALSRGTLLRAVGPDQVATQVWFYNPYTASVATSTGHTYAFPSPVAIPPEGMFASVDPSGGLVSVADARVRAVQQAPDARAAALALAAHPH